MWKVMWNAELCESLNCWIQIVPVEFSSTSIHVWVLDFYLLKKNACGSFFQQFPSFYFIYKKGKRKSWRKKKKNTATTTTTTKRETVPTTNLHFLIVSYKKKRETFFVIGRDSSVGIFLLSSLGRWRVKRNNEREKILPFSSLLSLFTYFSPSLFSFLISHFRGTIFEYCKSSTSDRER